MLKLYNLADKTISSSFYLLLFLVPLVFYPKTSEIFEFNKIMLTYAFTAIILASWAIKSILAGKPIFRRTILDIPLLLFLLSLSLSTITSIDSHTSLFGYYGRWNGGLLSMAAYTALYWAYVSNMDRKKTLSSMLYLLSSATFVAAWGILEHLGQSPSCVLIKGELGVDCWKQKVQERVFATLGQPNWMAAWLVAIAPISWSIAMSKIKNQNANIHIKNKKFLLWLVLSILFFLALLYTKSRSGLLGFATAYVVFWGSIFVVAKFLPRVARRAKWGISRQERRLKSATTNFLIFTFLYLILALALGTPFTPSLRDLTLTPTTRPTTESPPSSTQLETGGTESGEIRKIVWKGTVDAWRAYPILGSGVETFAYVYYQFRPVEHNLTSEWDFLYNKAHNEFLNYLATTGTLGLGAYLLLIGAAIWFFAKSIKEEVVSSKSEKLLLNHYYLILALASGYTSILVTNFFGFSVVPVATLFFLYPAMGFTLTHYPLPPTTGGAFTSKPTTHYPLPTTKQLVLLAFVLIAMFYTLYRISNLWMADFYYAQARSQNNQGQIGEAVRSAQRAIELAPQEANYYKELGASTALFAASTGDSSSAEISVEVLEKALALSPRNVSLHKSAAQIISTLSIVDQKYLLKEIEILQATSLLAPTDPKVFYRLGLALGRVGQEDKAKEALEKAAGLKPDYQDPKEALNLLK